MNENLHLNKPPTSLPLFLPLSLSPLHATAATPSFISPHHPSTSPRPSFDIHFFIPTFTFRFHAVAFSLHFLLHPGVFIPYNSNRHLLKYIEQCLISAISAPSVCDSDSENYQKPGGLRLPGWLRLTILPPRAAC